MTVEVRTEVVIDRPIDEVATYAADPSNAPEWYVNIDRVDWQTAPPAAVGFAYDLRRPVPRPPARALPAWRRLG